MAAPRMSRAAADARKQITSARESGFTQCVGSALGIERRFAGVSMMLGRTEFAVISVPRVSAAIACVIATTPALLEAYAAACVVGKAPVREPIVTIRP